MKQLMKVFELMVPGPIVLTYIVVTGVGMLIGSWNDNTDMVLIGVLLMLWIIAILLANMLRVLWQIRDMRTGNDDGEV